jgi:hypothetical protein
MIRRRLVALSIAVSLYAGVTEASAREEIRYELTSESWFGVVCELCYCPDSIAELHGTFLLRETGEKGGFRTFDVLEVQWRTGGGTQGAVTGSGTFRHGGTSGRQQQLELELRLGDEDLHLTSGPVEAELDLPRLAIQVETSLKPTCRDRVFFLTARPIPTD